MTHRPHRSALSLRLGAALAAAALLVACGGGGADEGNAPVLAEALLLSNPDIDGFAVKRGNTILGNAVAKPAAGDLAHPQGQQTYRGIYHFDLPALPAGATVISVEFSVVQQFVQGNPYGLMGSLIVDHIDMGPAYDSAAFDQFTLETIRDENGMPVALSTSSALGRKTLDVTAQVLADLDAGRGRSQFRVRGLVDTPDGDQVADLVNLSDGSDPESAAPWLRIVYELP